MDDQAVGKESTLLLLLIGAIAIALGVGVSLVLNRVTVPDFGQICQDYGGLWEDGECFTPSGEKVVP